MWITKLIHFIKFLLRFVSTGENGFVIVKTRLFNRFHRLYYYCYFYFVL